MTDTLIHSDSERLDYIDSLGVPFNHPDMPPGVRALVLYLPYLAPQDMPQPQSVRAAIDYLLDNPRSLVKADDTICPGCGRAGTIRRVDGGAFFNSYGCSACTYHVNHPKKIEP